MLDFFVKHKPITILIVALIAYYIIFILVYGKRKKRKKTPLNDKNYLSSSDKSKNFITFTPELDDVPVIESDVSSSGESTETGTDYKEMLEELDQQVKKINHNGELDDLLRDSGIETED